MKTPKTLHDIVDAITSLQERLAQLEPLVGKMYAERTAPPPQLTLEQQVERELAKRKPKKGTTRNAYNGRPATAVLLDWLPTTEATATTTADLAQVSGVPSPRCSTALWDLFVQQKVDRVPTEKKNAGHTVYRWYKKPGVTS